MKTLTPALVAEIRQRSREGTVTAAALAKELSKRFWKKVNVCNHGRRCKDCCWLWTSSTWPSGYGQVYLGRAEGKRIRVPAHRFAWELRYKAAIPPGLLALHVCDRPPCVNPAHIFIGTQTHNIQDASRKGRLRNQHHDPLHQGRRPFGDKSGALLHPGTHATGDRNGARTMPHRIVRGEQKANTTLTDENIRTIRRAYARGRKTAAQLTQIYGVGRSTMYRIIARETWTHVTQDPQQQNAADQRRRQPKGSKTTEEPV